MSGFSLHLLRHGEPRGAGRLLGHSDARPQVSGIATCLARASGMAVKQVLSSDLARADMPAKVIANAHGVPHRRDARWRELDFGHWDGADPVDLPQAELTAFWDDPDTFAPPGGETWMAVCERVSAALKDIDRSTLVVAHAGSIRAALSLVLGWNYRQSWSLALPYAALVSLMVWPGEQSSAQITGLVT